MGSTAADADLIIAGGGLASGLIAWRLKVLRPEVRVLILERGGKLGGEHTWSFFDTDVSPSIRAWLEPLVTYRWPGYSVAFPTHERRLSTGYNSVTSDRFHDVIAPEIEGSLRLGCEALEIHGDHVVACTGATLRAPAVIDARGPEPSPSLVLAWQKFLGVEVETADPHGIVEPVMMDARVPQEDGYRFIYLLPFSPTRLLIEDTRYADGPLLDRAALRTAVERYAQGRGWTIARVIRAEHGVLPIALAGDIETFWRAVEGEDVAARAGLRSALFHPTTGYSLPDAARLADAVAALPQITTATVSALVRRTSVEAWHARGFYRLVNRMLFRAAEPDQRYRVLQRFYRLSQPLIERFYAAEISRADKWRILSGIPPVPVPNALGCLSEQRLLHAEAA
jgi:lycopene beta-cyclase